jgi:hypothetical protein
MKKSILQFGNPLNKTEQKQVSGGIGNPCPCTTRYSILGGGACSFRALFPQGFFCYGQIQNGQCCVN